MDCSITVNDGMMSGKHATLLFRDEAYALKDEMSSHGTFVNGKNIGFETYMLKDSDEIRMGETIFKFRTSLVVFLWIKNKKKKEAALQESLESVRRETEAKANMAQQEAERISREHLAYQQNQERDKRTADAMAETEHLARLMQTKNLFPRLQCKVGRESFIYAINKPVTTLGREMDNDVVLNHSRTSRYHAKIVFTGNGFEIIDEGSTNKVIINGQFFERAMLKNGDIIGLGEAVISFYL